MTQRIFFPPVLAGLLFAATVPMPLLACTLCGGLQGKQDTMGEEMDRARLVLYGRAVSSEEFNHQGATPGSGRTNIQIQRILKDDPLLVNKKEVILGRWLPVDVKEPPRYLIFCAAKEGQLDAYLGKAIRSEAAVAYLEGAIAVRKQGRAQALQYYFQFLDDADEVIAGDAFLEFARANDAEVEQVRRSLKPDKIRALMQNPRTNVEFLGLLGFLLGGCGEQRDADFLLAMINRNDEPSRKAREGLLAGYLSLKPREGWEVLRAHLADANRPIVPDRYAAINAVRFCYALKLGDFQQGMLHCMKVMIPDGDAADFAVEDLRSWKIWDLTPQVLAQYDRPSHAAPITKRAIIRYALCCPQTEARQFLDRISARDREIIREVAEGLQ